MLEKPAIISIEQLNQISQQQHKEGKSIVLVGGCFDLLHLGHITLLEKAKEQGNSLFVLLESDTMIKQRKGIDRPLHTQEQRAQLLSALRAVDVIVLLQDKMTNQDYDEVVKKIKPAIIAATRGDTFAQHKERQAMEVGARLVFVNDVIPNVSTSRLLSLLEKEN